ncbi:MULTISPECIES: hypothetical protein [Acinetobacter calcoaceticus/baumannii complex]|uniref:hypothetical protein n=1 Tax=Acinetobacter calcoaceticus/baumannii complex TaxID=909768 RepID=UPI002940331B|nr:hypothetical protein [Acinetobacter baumannii]MDV4328457.1 hypothetical protein [Acinetobacter baumannii]MDV4331777.1 hypothetical protein [Acinetobacter baumannii]
MNNNFLFLNYSLPIEYAKNYPDANSPVTFNNDGSILSYFKDSIWELTPYIYRPSTVNKLNFKKIILDSLNIELKEQLIYQAKLIIYGLMYFNTNSRSITASYISECFYGVKKLVQIAYEYNFSIDGLSKNKIFSTCILNYFRNKDKRILSNFITLLRKISRLSITYADHDFSLHPSQFFDLISFRNRMMTTEIKQHLVIPTRIYTLLIEKLKEVFEDYLNYKNGILKLFKAMLDFNNIKSSNKSYIKINNFLLKIIQEFNLEEFVEKYNVKCLRRLKLLFSSLIELSKISILLFSGMRISECLILPFNTLKKSSIKNKEIYILSGYTSKLTKVGPMKTVWISSSLVEPAITAAMDLGKLYAYASGIEILDFNQFPLFYSPITGAKINLYNYSVHSTINHLTAFNFFGLDLTLNEFDLQEMRKIELLSDLHERNVKVNFPFPLSSHQFRRSLTVYASRSGIVQIPALKGQLKHITEDMTYYYGSNSHLAPNYIFDETLIDTFNEEQLMESLLSFKEDVIETEIPLFGAEGTRLQIAKENKKIPLFLTDLKQTEQAMRDGKLSYRRTPLGGCARKEQCDKTAFISITACISCKDAVFSSKSIKALEKTKYHFMSRSFPLNHDDPYKKQLLCEIKEINSILRKYKNRIGVINVSEIDE